MMSTLLDNRYRVLTVLGNGGCGQTFVAEDTRLPSNPRCVVKQLKPATGDAYARQIIQERFEREAVVLDTIGKSHNQIPKLHAYFSEANEFYLVQEWIEGKNLTQKVKTGGTFSQEAVKKFLLNFLPILEYVHSQRIIHRDIKPENILIRDKDGKPVLIDFGAVKEAVVSAVGGDGTLPPTIVIGTPEFMPPEQIRGNPVYASDLYSLGLTAIFLLTGKRPHEFANDPRDGKIQWRKHVRNITPDFASILDKAIQPLTTNRYQTARQMRHAISPPKKEPVFPFLSFPVVCLILVALLAVGIGALFLIKSIADYNKLAEEKDREAQQYKIRSEKEAQEKEKADKESQNKLQQEKGAREAAEARVKELEEIAGNGKIESVSEEHNVSENNVRGMRIHVKFVVNNFRNAKCSVAAYFEYSNGTEVKSSDGRYQTDRGQVAVSTQFIPTYVNAVFNDVTLFMPYDELHTGQGTYQLRFNVRLYRQGGKFFAASDYHSFNFSR